ncbi:MULTISPECIES: alpha/beta hydrolase [unclassified Wenzhouxiangella]|uniref:alpha/beta hydrolase n=1 Tax=unclassified Wenzhouxiangella TaxID=2613841 RepID=UPI000E32CE9D|nr:MULTISPECIES: alpha/beta hydrolase [unclassified Wenzhouxiangella]RFF27402.1 alpha/beta hydrolase [Wenzhouxiangella sp. 15181]RFP68830.1 alpha/beta hydrolase [Wenzhouxiangella sp. 15190]
MGFKSRFRAIFCGVLIGLTSAPALAQEDRVEDRWAGLNKCELSAAGGRLTADALCGTLTVAENPEQPEGRQLELAFAVKEARASAVLEDPVVFLAGGPGQSARDALPIMQRALRELNRERDLIFLDQRGTGGSNALECGFDDQGELWLEPDWDEVNRQLRGCLDDWEADVRLYTTTQGASDLEAFREAFGFESLNLIGGSYGTRMAQVYLRNYPERVRSVVLDGVVPTRLALGAEHAMMLDRALGKVFTACSEDATCGGAFPGLQSAFEELKTRYRNENPQLVVTHPRTGEGIDLHFTRDVLASALRFLAYNPETQMMIPYLVHEAASTGSPARLASQAMIVSDRMNDMIAIGLNFAVGCSEDWPVWPDDIDQSETLLGDSMTEIYEQVCSWWPAGDTPADFHEPFDADVPVLLMSGELDPVTPPDYGEEAAAQFSDSRHLVADGRGHIVLTNPCMSSIATQFVRDAGVSDLDVDCMDRIGHEPFFIDLLGPAP